MKEGLNAGLGLLFFFPGEELSCRNAEEARKEHVGKGVSNGEINAHEETVESKADHPDHGVPDIQEIFFVIFLQNEIVRNLNGDHGCEDGANQIQEAGDVVHVEENGTDGSDDGHDHGNLLAAALQLVREGFCGDAGRPGIQEGCGDGGENQNEKSCDAKACFDHDDSDVGFSGNNGSAHADDVHPYGDQAVDNHADQRCLPGLVGFSCVVTDQRQPGQRHGNSKLDRCAEGHGIGEASLGRDSSAENDKGQHQSQNEQCGHGNLVDDSKVGDTDGDPQKDQRTDHDGPYPASNAEDLVGGKSAVIDHDGSPADQLQNIQKGEEDAALGAEAHFRSFHGALFRLSADETCEVHHGTADEMSQKNRCKAFSKAERCKICSCQNFGDGYACAEPDQS